MKQAINEVGLSIRRQKAGVEEIPFLERKTEAKGTAFRFLKENAQGCFWIGQRENCQIGTVSVSLKNEPFRENDNLALAEPIELAVSLQEKPVRMTAMYLHRDWWTRPAFVNGWEELPERTQCVYLDYGDTFGFLLLTAGKAFKTMARGKNPDCLTLVLTAYRAGQSSAEETVFVYAEGKTVFEAVRACSRTLSEETGVILKEKKEYPAMFDRLGWCSWDAFYTDITEEKVRKKAAELAEKKIPAGWFLLDDGWLSVRDNRLYDLCPEKEKFPEGFQAMIRDIKESGSVDYVGVWHALGGYWGGIEPGSSAALAEASHLYGTASGKLLPYPEAERGYGFYRDWYELLRRQGIDFVKVDGQSAVKNYYENDIPVCQAARETHKALEGAAGAYMGSRLINCMGMGMENVMGRQGSAMSRNSDDFVPDNPQGFIEHLLQNAYNAPWHDEFYYCDWDMFWTSHPDAKKHALLRAVSGGPVYVSDRIGETDPDTVWPLVYEDGSLLRMDRAAKPAFDCMFTDPSKEGLLKLTNIAGCGRGGERGGILAVYNISPAAGTGTICAADIPELGKQEYYCYDWTAGRGRRTAYEEAFPVTLEAGGFALYLFVPCHDGFGVLGLADKFVSFHAVEEVRRTASGFAAVVRQSGMLVFGSLKNVTRCLINGEDRTGELIREGELYRLFCADEGKLLVMVETE